MSYIVKFIDNALYNNIDVELLYKNDIKYGHKILFVCSVKYKNILQKYGIKQISNSTDITNTNGNLFVFYCDKNTLDTTIDCAYKLDAECQIYIKTDGVYSADPSYTDFSHKIDKIDYNEMLEMALCGYKAIDTEIIEKSRKLGVSLRLLSYLDSESKGTIVKEVLGMSGPTIKGIIKDPNISIVTLIDVPDITGICFKIFDLISQNNISVDTISLPTAVGGKGEISFTIKRSDRLKCETLLRENITELGFKALSIDDNVAKVSVIGAALKDTKGIAAKVFKILYENKINLKLINTSEIKLSVIVDKSLSDIAVMNIHKMFID